MWGRALSLAYKLNLLLGVWGLPPAGPPPPLQYCGAHGAAELRKWAGWAKQWVAQGRTVWFAFNNDAVAVEGELPPAVSDCRDLAAALRGNGLWSG